MAKLVAMYKRPANVAAFDEHYFAKHVPIAKRVPGLRRYEVNTTPPAAMQGESPYHLVAILSFDSIEALQMALSSPEGQATAADLANFAGAGVDLLTFATRDV